MFSKQLVTAEEKIFVFPPQMYHEEKERLNGGCR